MVVVDIGEVPANEPWLQETTYLVDSLGHTTAIVAQTDEPTSGVNLQPVPFTLTSQQALVHPSATTRSRPSSLGRATHSITPPPFSTPASSNPTSTPKKPHSRIVFAATAIGAVVGICIMAVLIYLVRKRSRQQRLHTDKIDGVWTEEKTGSWDLFDTWDTLGMAPSEKRQMNQGYGLRSLQEVQEDYRRFNSMTDEQRHALIVYERRNNGILRKDQAESGSSNPVAATPPTRILTSKEARNPVDQDKGLGRVTLPAQPASILKRPAREGMQDATDEENEGYHHLVQGAQSSTAYTIMAGRKKLDVWRDELNRISIVDRWIGRRFSRATISSSTSSTDSEG